MKKFAAAALLTALCSVSPAHANLNTGLVGYWSFDDCTATDNSGHGYNGSINGTASCVDGASGKGFKYQGAMDENIKVDKFPEIKKALTISAFIQLDKAHIGTGNPIVTKGSAKEEVYTLWASKEAVYIIFNWDTNSRFSCRKTANLQPDTTYQVGATYDTGLGKVTLFLNGKSLGTCDSTIELVSQTEPLYFSSSYPGAQEYLKGMIDEVRIYNRALSAAEMLSLYYKVNPPVIKGSAPWGTAHSVVCRNVTIGDEVTLPTTKSSAWDCEKAGLEVRSGDKVEVTISGKKF